MDYPIQIIDSGEFFQKSFQMQQASQLNPIYPLCGRSDFKGSNPQQIRIKIGAWLEIIRRKLENRSLCVCDMCKLTL